MNSPAMLKIKKIRESAQPLKKAYENPACTDIAIVHLIDVENGIARFGTGWTVEIPTGYLMLLFPRSSTGKKGWRLSNDVGVLDEDYRGEIIVSLEPSFFKGAEIIIESMKTQILINDLTEKMAKSIPLPSILVQFMICKKDNIPIQEVDSLSETQRGIGGFGSSDSIK